jgi:hypothetical protein
MMQTAQQSPFNPQQHVRGSYKTEQNFYKPSGSGIRPDPHLQPPPQQYHPMTGNYGYPESRNSQSQMQQYGGGMGVLNYNAYSQKEYDDLKEQFFRPPNMARPPMEPYHRMSEGMFNLMKTMPLASTTWDLAPARAAT